MIKTKSKILTKLSALVSLLVITIFTLNCGSAIHSANVGGTIIAEEETKTIENNIAPKSELLAFPGADGGGKYTTGGRGGRVIKVTNLNNNGPGSLRAALREHDPRIVIFEVSGTIELAEQLVINNGNITIAGQSAPGDGICIKNFGFRINADNVIIRYMRFRPGDTAETELDAFTSTRQKDIIIDHCSMSWSTDETASFYDNENATFQWCIVSESLNKSVHSKGEHGYGGIWGGINTSFLNNILAHHSSRNPRLQGTRYQGEEAREQAEMVNNIVYNWGNKAIYGGEGGKYNIINNIFIPGPATRSSSRNEILEPYAPAGKFYLSGNLLIDGNNRVQISENNVSLEEETIDALADNPFALNNMASPSEPLAVFETILEKAGASHVRDAVDKRIINEIRNRSFTYGNSGIIDSPNDTEGWPELVSKTPEPDSDNDGMPDEWEKSKGLDPADPTDNNTITLHSHYTNIEVYLNELVE